MKDYEGKVFSVKQKGSKYFLGSSQGDFIKKKHGKVKVITTHEKGIIVDEEFFQLKTKNIVTDIMEYLVFYSKDQALARHGYDNRYVNVNFKTGEISREFSHAFGDYYYDDQDKLFSLDKDGNSIYTEYERASTDRTSGYLDNDTYAVKNKEGKVVIVDEKAQKKYQIEFDSREDIKDISISGHRDAEGFYDKSKGQLTIFSKGKEVFSRQCGDFELSVEDNHMVIYEKDKDITTVYAIDKDLNVNKEVLSREGVDLKFSNKDKYMRVYEKENNKTTIYTIDKDLNITGENVFDGKVAEINESTDKTFVVTSKEKGNYEVSTLDDKKVLFDNCTSVRFKYIPGFLSRLSRFVIQYAKKDEEGNSYVGLFDPVKEEFLMKPEQKIEGIDLTVSRVMKEDGETRFFAYKDGNYGVVNQEGKTLVDFKYQINGPRTEVSLSDGGMGLELEDKYGKKRYLDIESTKMIYGEKDTSYSRSSSSKSEKNKEKNEEKKENKRSEDLQDILDTISCVSAPLGAIIEAILDD